MPAPPFQCNHLDIGQYPDASENIHATSHWCFRLSRAARAGTAAGCIFLSPTPPPPPHADKMAVLMAVKTMVLSLVWMFDMRFPVWLFA